MKFSRVLACVALIMGTASAVALPVEVREAKAVALANPVTGIAMRQIEGVAKIKRATYEKKKRQDDGDDDDGDDDDDEDGDGDDDDGDDDDEGGDDDD